MSRHAEPPLVPSPRPAALDGLRVLVVEDHAIGRILLQAMLAGLGITAALAGSGEEAREAVRTHDFDVVLIDLGLPDVHGEDLARSLARDARPAFVAVTGRERPNVLPAIFADWLEKPFSVRELHHLLAGLVAGVARSA
ncbi:response regulator [Pinisolibacter sp.]|uniref:response regulator n=1 Tax=Pinisolibacter sp. TaxID=2172024 RepID=UPI002FDD54A8